MKHSFSARARYWLGLSALLAGLPTVALGQAPNPLGVEWVGSGAAKPASPPPASNPLGVEWVGGSKDVTRPAPAPAPAADNPLGVEWVGSSGSGRSAATTPSPTAGNPLGVEWVGGGASAAKPVPSPTSGSRPDGAGAPRPSPLPPQPPAPTQPPSPAPEKPAPQPPAPVPPAPGANQASLPAALIDSWSYQAVAFSSSSGTVSETRGVSGTLKFKPDGQYEQALSIGGIANVMKGSYRIVGGRLETTYLWRGESVTDSFDLYLDPTGKRLTLAGHGSPRSLYTLQRME